MRIFMAVAAISLLGAVSTTAGAQEAGTGARMASEARLAGDSADRKEALSAQWKKGERMAADGGTLLRRSERRLLSLSRDAKRLEARADKAVQARLREEAALARGQRMVKEGESLQLQAEAQFGSAPSA